MNTSYNRVVTTYNNGITEVVDYSNSIEVGFTREKKEVIKSYGRVKLGRIKGKKKGFNEKNVYINALRAKKKIRQLCNNNVDLLTKFITLTFAIDITETDIKLANSLFSKFIKRLEYSVNQKVEYLCVPELTQKGIIHYHMLCNIPYVDIKEIQKIWSHGIVYINKIEDINNVAGYISNYIDKDFGKTFCGVRHFFKSKGVVYPTSQKIDSSYDYNLYNDDNLVYVNIHENTYCGNVKIRVYNKNEKWS